MDASDLRIFEAVARLGAMNRAATELNTVQSNVTARIRALEGELKTPLFRRHRGGVALTSAGERLLPYALRIRRMIDEARRAALDDGTPKGRLTVGALESTAAHRLSPLLAGYVAAHPAVDLVLRTGTTCELIDKTLAHEVDGAFVCGPVDHRELVAEAVFREELVLLTARGARGLAALAQVHDLKLVVLRAGCSYRQRLEAILAARGIVATRLLEFGTLDAIIACVAAGLGVTLLPRTVVAQATRDRRVTQHELAPAEAAVETLFIRRRDTYVSSALAAFLDAARRAERTAANAAE
ncbi:MAG TPA: LysR substrate-binding domain-containing protein [Alphaproteobacteria bacterium]|nr:LysR substrate-binding domain-containing protein [Alphaproteobacteria bacterium]